MSDYETVYRAYRSKFYKSILFETESAAKAYDFRQAKFLLDLNPDDAIEEAERDKILAKYQAEYEAERTIKAAAE